MSEPRRYTLYCRESDGRMANVRVQEAPGSELGWGDTVPVREDTCCEADVEAVVAWLQENYEAALDGPRSVLEREAADLLARLFKDVE